MEKTLEVDSASRARAFAATNQRVDWFRVIVALERKGHSSYSLAEATKVPRSTFGGWRCGDHEPSHHGGEALIALWMRETVMPRSELPMRDAPASVAKARR